jgi:DcaP outer membrane protein
LVPLVGAAVALCLARGDGDAQTRASAPDSLLKRPRIEFFGQFVTDVIHDFNSVDPAFYDVLRPTQLPAFKGEFGADNHSYFSVRPTRFGVRTTVPTKAGDVRGIFDWDLFGSGANRGRTAFNLVRAYAEVGQFGAGQFDSPFMDIDVFPNTLEYWGPTGIVFFRNIQFRYMPIQGDSRVTIAIERPGASADRGDLDDHLDLANVIGRFPWPDLSAQGRLGRKWGYVQLAGILRGIYWDDLIPNDTFDLSGHLTGWGFSASSKVKTNKTDALKMQITYGRGIQDYMDAPFDVGLRIRRGVLFDTLKAVTLPVFAGLLFYDHSWNEKVTSSLGWSGLRVTNSSGQRPLAYHSGQYALVNLLYSPAPDLLVGGEFQWGRRTNAFDGFTPNDFRIQLTARFNYSITLKPDREKDDGK